MAEFNLKKALKAIEASRTDEQVQEQDALNAVGRSGLDPSSPQERIARAKQFEDDIRAQIDFLVGEPDSEVKTMRLNTAFDRLGELLAEQGDYAQAAVISKTPERREHYKQILKAINRPNDKVCKCEPDTIVDRANGVEFQSPASMIIEQIVDEDGNLLNLERCRKCGFMVCRT